MEATIFVRRRSPIIATLSQPGGCPGRARTRAHASDLDLSSPQQATGVANLRAISGTAPYLRHDGPLAFAHRGGGHEAPENTLAAFERAVGLGFRYLETDARLTADGVVVAFHDPTLDRLTDRGGRISELDWADVSAARVHGSEPVPRLADVLGAWESVRFNIDPKCDEVVEPLAALVRDLGMVERVCFGSFKARRTARLGRILGPAVCRSLGPAGVARLWLGSRGVPLPALAGAAGCVQVPAHIEGRALVDRRFVEAAHRRGLQVHVWTVDDPDHMGRLLDLGVDGLMTDRPSVLRRVLQARDSW